jgi:hypothetical protein
MLKMSKLDIKELKEAYDGNKRSALMSSTKSKPKTIDEYLAGVNADQRAALEKLRETIRTVAQGGGVHQLRTRRVSSEWASARRLRRVGESLNACHGNETFADCQSRDTHSQTGRGSI